MDTYVKFSSNKRIYLEIFNYPVSVPVPVSVSVPVLVPVPVPVPVPVSVPVPVPVPVPFALRMCARNEPHSYSCRLSNDFAGKRTKKIFGFSVCIFLLGKYNFL